MSARFGLPVAFVLFIALLPTAIHSYVGMRIEDGLTTAAIPDTLEGYVGSKTSRNANWGERRFDSTDWIERSYQAGGRDVRLVVVRSFDLKKLYHHPELAAAYGVDLRPAGSTGQRRARPSCTRSRRSGARARSSMYALMYDGVFIEDPLWFQLRTAGKLLVGGRRQMTLFFVHQANVPANQPPADTAAALVLGAAVDAFANQRPGRSAVAGN